jgi:hypothetical protein
MDSIRRGGHLKRRSRWLALTTVLAMFAPGTGAGSACAETLPVTIPSFMGTPADSAARKAFMTAFEEAFAAGRLPCEHRDGDTWGPADERTSPFVRVDAADPAEAWQLTISIGVPREVRVDRPKAHDDDKLPPPPRISDMRTSRGLTVVVSARSPRDVTSDVAVEPQRFALYFAGARRVVVPTAKLPSGGYAYPWADAGRVVARAALEALLRAHGDLGDGDRADLAPATRTEGIR